MTGLIHISGNDTGKKYSISDALRSLPQGSSLKNLNSKFVQANWSRSLLYEVDILKFLWFKEVRAWSKSDFHDWERIKDLSTE